jgi:hypothetical protein
MQDPRVLHGRLRPLQSLHQKMDYGTHHKVEDTRANRCLKCETESAGFTESPEKRPREDDRD